MNWALHCGHLKDQILQKFKRGYPFLILKTTGIIQLSGDSWKACYFYHFERIETSFGRGGWTMSPEIFDAISLAHYLHVQ